MMRNSVINESADSRIGYITLAVSLLLHILLLIQFAPGMAGSRASAPKYDTRVSLNLLPPPAKTVVEEKSQAVKLKKTKTVRIEKNTEMQQAVVEKLASANTVAEKIQRETDAVDPLRHRYLTDLLTHIEGYKYYPRSAKRRGIEGSISVSFRLLSDGNIDGLDVSGEPAMLRHAAKGAVKKALPLPRPPEEIGAPVQISYAMQYQLD